MKIGVSGASGQLGKATISELCIRGGNHEIIGISRSPDAVAAPALGRRGDYDHPETLAQAYEGLDRLLIIPSADLRPGARGKQLTCAIDAAVAAGVGQIVLMTTAGTSEAEEPAFGAAFWTAEQHLMRHAPHWSILRMNYYAEALLPDVKLALDSGVMAGLGDERVAYVSRADVASAAAGLLLSDGHLGAIYNTTGPAVLTGQDRAALASELTGKSISYVAVTAEQFGAQLAKAGLPEIAINAITAIRSTFISGKLDIVTGDVERLSGQAPRSLRDVLARAFG